MAPLLAWTRPPVVSSHLTLDEDEASADLDEPPDFLMSCPFQKSPICRLSHSTSLLTRALHGLYGGDEHGLDALDTAGFSYPYSRSLASSASLHSTAELTSDTGFTSASRASTPSIPDMTVLHPREATNLDSESCDDAHVIEGSHSFATPVPQRPQRKRCISFQCGNAPVMSIGCDASKLDKNCGLFDPPLSAHNQPTQMLIGLRSVHDLKSQVLILQDPPKKKGCLKLACDTRPIASQLVKDTAQHSAAFLSGPTTTIQQVRCLAPDSSLGSRKSSCEKIIGGADDIWLDSSSPKPPKPAAVFIRPKLIQPTTKELKESSHFHEFALTDSQDDEWLEEDKVCEKSRITIGDILRKEKTMRRLVSEAFKEAEDEDSEFDDDDDNSNNNSDSNSDSNSNSNSNSNSDCVDEDADGDGVSFADADELNEIDDGDVSEVDAKDGNKKPGNKKSGADRNGYNDWASDLDGYRTDEETGFADSDDEFDLNSHTFGTSNPCSDGLALRRLTPVFGLRLDKGFFASSTPSERSFKSAQEIIPPRRRRRRARTPELPDSTDFVCGTLDEDRPLEALYLSRIAAKKRHKLHVIPQDIDPSFPTSDLEDELGNRVQKPASAIDGSAYDRSRPLIQGHAHNIGIGQLSGTRDIHRKNDPLCLAQQNFASPRRFYSPPPKRSAISHGRGHFARPTSKHHTMLRLKSPVPIPIPLDFNALQAHNAESTPFLYGDQLRLRQAKSLPKPTDMTDDLYLHLLRKSSSSYHKRGAIDIVKGLEQRRHRRREKFFQKYCDRARRGQGTDHKPQPGLGAKKMKEVGLHVTKREQCYFVISF